MDIYMCVHDIVMTWCFLVTDHLWGTPITKGESGSFDVFLDIDVSFPERNQLYPLIILHVQCSLCVHYVHLHKRTYHFQIEINYILSSSCTFNVVCVYMYVYLHKRAYHFQIEINHILLSSCTFNVVCVYSMSIYTKGTYHFQIEINYILSSSCTFNVVCVYMYVYLHKRAYHFQIEINYTLSSSCAFNVVYMYSMSIYTKGRIISK